MIDIPDTILPVDDQGRRICPKCQKVTADCSCPSFDPNRPKTDQFLPRVKLDKKGRRGKIVTVIQGLPVDKLFLKELSKKAKSLTGSGGTCYLQEGEGVIEVQGNHQVAIRKLLDDEQFQ